MNFLQAVVLGIVQGLTEFLPVSSTGHLELVKALLGVDLAGANILFDAVLHIGTLAAVLTVYKDKIVAMVKTKSERIYNLIISTIPAGFAGIFFDGFIEERCLNGLVIGVCFMITSVLLLLSEVKIRRNLSRYPVDIKRASAMGFAQIFALLPGISRSGVTVSAGILSGGERSDAADFSFLMSVPIILGSLFFKLLKACFTGEISLAIASLGGGINGAICLTAGVAAAFLTGALSIKLFLSFVKKGSFKVFCLYLVLAAALSLYLYFAGIFS